MYRTRSLGPGRTEGRDTPGGYDAWLPGPKCKMEAKVENQIAGMCRVVIVGGARDAMRANIQIVPGALTQGLDPF